MVSRLRVVALISCTALCALVLAACGSRAVAVNGSATASDMTSAGTFTITPSRLSLGSSSSTIVESVEVYVGDELIYATTVRQSELNTPFTVSGAGGYPAGSRITLRLEGRAFAPAETVFGWYRGALTLPAATAAPAAAAAPTAVAFAHATPAGDERTLVDARLSTGTGALTYAWSPAECAGTTDLGGAPTPAGTAFVAYGFSGDCTVTVTSAAGATATATVAVTHRVGLHNGSFAFDGTSTATVRGVRGVLGDATRACVDLTGAGAYATEVALTGFSPPTGSVTLTALTAGTHQLAATLWTGTDNVGCANTGGTGAAQVIRDLYTVDAAGAVAAARRGSRASSFIAPSSLRLVSSKTISEGTYDEKAGAIVGATTSGSFTWSTPAMANGVKRPAGAASLAKGAYAMRSIDMVQGPLVGRASTLLGTGTVLLRGVDGTLACGTLAGGFDSSTLTLAGGTRAARTLAGNVTGKRVTYLFPTAAATSRSGGASGLLGTALGWITGGEPSERAAKPSAKPKPVKVRPVRASGTASLQTAAKPTGLPAPCRALVRHLPR